MTEEVFFMNIPAKSPFVLVTGGGGFIGSHLVEMLLEEKFRVRVLSYSPEDENFLKQAQVQIVQGDIRDDEVLDKCVLGVDWVFHLACVSRYNANIQEKDYWEVNCRATESLLKKSFSADVKRFIHISSIEAVGYSQDGLPLNEQSPHHPRNIYGKTKLEGEKIALEFSRKTGMDVRVVRPPMTYGPREKVVFERMFRPIHSWGIYPLFGQGKPWVEFCYVKNMVRGLLLVAEKGKAGEIYFLSDVRSYTFREVLETMAEIMGRPLRFIPISDGMAWVLACVFEGLAKIFPFYPFYIQATGCAPFSRRSLTWLLKSSVFCDISKAQKELGFASRYSLKEGLRETVSWYRAHGLLK